MENVVDVTALLTEDKEQLKVGQKVKVVLFYAKTKSVVATQRRFRVHVGTKRWAH
jgi:predicted RNA-binding protein (virulence factor B family)